MQDCHEQLLEHGRTTEGVYQTANNAVERLEADGVVTEMTRNKQNRVFRAEEIMEIVERPVRELPDPGALVDVEQAWNLPER
ncbi:hypothetical protein HTIA_0559 [Halorhabdus tiamatea SARL4B]|nr:hypothetical protein HTIA_0559 [Halorhabdus tiamatea SARL4B]